MNSQVLQKITKPFGDDDKLQGPPLIDKINAHNMSVMRS